MGGTCGIKVAGHFYGIWEGMVLNWKFWERAYRGRLVSRVYSDPPETDQHTLKWLVTFNDIKNKRRV